MKVFVGVSGGVDSSVSAALLQKAGHEVVGVFLRVWQPDFLPCSWREERVDAKRVCATLNIPFLEIDCSLEYKRDVADYMIREYKAGRTPNPDVMCNAHIKFGVFFEKARAMGADMVATGHYAQAKSMKGVEGVRLLVGVDHNKDQSYFLWQLTQDKLAHVMFPIGGMKKEEVRAQAKEFNLHTATKKDSQGLCFLGKLDMHDFLLHFVEEKEGELIDETGAVIGTHTGSVFLTIGQRHGFTVTKKTPHDMPYYVIAKDIEKNTVTVSQHPNSTLHKKETDKKETTVQTIQTIRVSQTNWICTPPKSGERFSARLRYRQPLFEVTVQDISDSTAHVIPSEPQAFVPIGQSLVLYRGDECIGGGIIEQ